MRLWRFQAVASRGFFIPFLVSRILFGISSCSFLAFANADGVAVIVKADDQLVTLRVGETAESLQILVMPALLVLDVLVFLVHSSSFSRKSDYCVNGVLTLCIYTHS